MERLTVPKGPYPIDGLYLEHYYRYCFARQYVANLTVLDCACGTGYGAYQLARKAKQVIGVDRSPEAIAFARSHWGRRNVCYELLDIDRLSELNKMFDRVVSFETIEHLAGSERFVNNVVNLLREGGLFIVSTPDRDTYRAGLASNPFHLHEFNQEEFLALLSQKFKHVDLFSQLLIGDEKSLEKNRPLKSAAPFKKRLLQNSLISSFYIFSQRKRFEVVRRKPLRKYGYLVAVCQK